MTRQNAKHWHLLKRQLQLHKDMPQKSYMLELIEPSEISSASRTA